MYRFAAASSCRKSAAARVGEASFCCAETMTHTVMMAMDTAMLVSIFAIMGIIDIRISILLICLLIARSCPVLKELHAAS